VLALVSVPFAPLLLSMILPGQPFCLQIHVYAVMRDADLVQLSDRALKHLRPEPVASVCRHDDLCFMLVIWLPGTSKVLVKNRFFARFTEAFPDLLNPPARDLQLPRDLFCSLIVFIVYNDYDRSVARNPQLFIVIITILSC
jgi:hypothetical protein